ncbi:AGE family epimerase/isomerase [Carboxylicivirga sp. N1Y90]|uniref:AGE family epimerase/isomerase n=1 Tax=Carboxylicivirga fragile TaxID=3417571 RepID=UPI003D34AB7C|nr:AGE family epimerase/isomerase [Marinilabiliaceae bacterium N1Y90]
MEQSKIDSYIKQYSNELFQKVIPFWMNHSKDEVYGGYFTCLSRDGQVYDTDKFIWLQAREVWQFAKLYNTVEPKQEWLDMALHGAEFLQKHGKDEDGNWYFSLNQNGEPLVQPYNIFSDCFATMAFGQLYKATGHENYATLAKDTFYSIIKRQNNPKGTYNKIVPGTRELKNFALPMILSNLAMEIETLLPKAFITETLDKVIHEVMDVFYLEDQGLILENVSPDGQFVDCFEGRLLNPGHAIESMWFMMDLGKKLKRPELIEKAVKITLDTLEYGWDKEHGGIFYFMDLKGHPNQQLEWDQKLWWVHLETLVALLKGYQHTGNVACWEWFTKVHDYAFKHFSDPEHGEWFGYLNRRGEVLLPLKGGKWKGCFHVPRGLMIALQTLENIKKTL